jgi:hypothetical protein
MKPLPPDIEVAIILLIKRMLGTLTEEGLHEVQTAVMAEQLVREEKT